MKNFEESSPARGTWVEMQYCPPTPRTPSSRLPHGGRGLKFVNTPHGCHACVSSPARGTWVEMNAKLWIISTSTVVSRTGDVG